MTGAIRIIGLDPGLRRTGWGVIEVAGAHVRHVADGCVVSDDKAEIGQRLAQLFDRLTEVLRQWQPAGAAVEQTFVNQNPVSTLKLGMARGVVVLAPARYGITVTEYAPNQVKKSVVGVGHAEKDQIAMMVRHLLPGAMPATPDAADALAVALCHGQRLSTGRALARAARPAVAC